MTAAGRVQDTEWMRRALDVARATIGLASPNPMVGCVIVCEGKALGEGAHRYELLDHAEIVALKTARALGHNVRGATAYVTLEPCSHHGRTGPCADALIAAGMGRVVVGTLDPNPQVSGRGVQRMRAAGISVDVGVCEADARMLNNGFAAWIRSGRPFVTLKAALSVDGMLAPPASARVAGETFWITGPEARAEVQQMRHAADAVLTGIGTVLADDPQLTDRSGSQRRRRLLRVVLDSHLRTPLDSKLVTSAHEDALLFCGEDADAQKASELREAGVEVLQVPCKEGRLNLGGVLDELGRRKVLNLLLECGSQLNGAFLHDGLVDAAVLFYAEQELGAGSIPFAAGVGAPSLVEQQLRGVQRSQVGTDMLVQGYWRDPWAKAFV